VRSRTLPREWLNEPGSVDGRTWDRNEAPDDRLDETALDVSRFLQGLLVDRDGRPISLSATGLHFAIGRIRDILGDASELRELAVLVLRRLVAEE
jgi:hypothetical protein